MFIAFKGFRCNQKVLNLYSKLQLMKSGKNEMEKKVIGKKVIPLTEKPLEELPFWKQHNYRQFLLCKGPPAFLVLCPMMLLLKIKFCIIVYYLWAETAASNNSFNGVCEKEMSIFCSIFLLSSDYMANQTVFRPTNLKTHIKFLKRLSEALTVSLFRNVKIYT